MRTTLFSTHRSELLFQFVTMTPNFLSFLLFFSLLASCRAQLSPSFYDQSCPLLPTVVSLTMRAALLLDPRMGASILRLFFHDCFVNGCDASVLLDDTGSFTGEKTAGPNANSLRGFGVIDNIKTAVELVCPRTVSCSDILALAAREGVVQLGGPSWTVRLGRRDATTASLAAANSNLPGPASSLSQLISFFAAKGLNAHDMTALSGAHTIGRARCVNFRAHIYNDTDIDPGFASGRRRSCPASGGDNNLAPLDLQTPDYFDNSYYQNLVAQQGLLHSDQELFNGRSQAAAQVQQYADDYSVFAADFAAAMIKMGNISPLTGNNGQIRFNCRRVN